MAQQQQQCHYPSRAMNAFLVVGGVIPAALQLGINTYRYTNSDCSFLDDDPDTPLVIASNVLSICVVMAAFAYMIPTVVVGGRQRPCYVSVIPHWVKWAIVSLTFVCMICGWCVVMCMHSDIQQWCVDTLAPSLIPFVKGFANPINMLLFFGVMLYDDAFPGHDATKCRPWESEKKKTD